MFIIDLSFGCESFGVLRISRRSFESVAITSPKTQMEAFDSQ